LPQFIGNTQFRSTFEATKPSISVGYDGRVGIHTASPNSTFHVAGTITADALIVDRDTDTQQDSATIYGFNPRFNQWADPSSPADGWTAVGSNWSRSTDAFTGAYSVDFENTGSTNYWYRNIDFDGQGENHEPLYQNIFLTGSYSYKLDSYTDGTPGISITLSYRDAANKDSKGSTTFVAPIAPDHTLNVWQTINWRAVTPKDKEIIGIRIELDPCRGLTGTDATDGTLTYPTPETSLATGISSIKYDNIIFDFNHPSLRIDNEGSIFGAFIKDLTVTNQKVANVIHSISWNQSTPGSGWHIDKDGNIQAGGIIIYDGDNQPIIRGGGGPAGSLQTALSSHGSRINVLENVTSTVDINSPALGFKLNHSKFNVDTAKYLWVHSFGSDGEPSATKNGFTVGVDGTRQNVIPGVVNSIAGNTDAWVIWRSDTTNPYDSDSIGNHGHGDDFKMAINELELGWMYVSGADEWTVLPSPEEYLALGTISTNATHVESASISNFSASLDWIEEQFLDDTQGTDLTTAGEMAFKNWNFNIGKFAQHGNKRRWVPAGLEAFRYDATSSYSEDVYGYVNPDPRFRGNRVLRISNTAFASVSDKTVGVVTPAIALKPGETHWAITYSAKVSSGSDVTAPILRIVEYDADLDDKTKTHISYGGGSANTVTGNRVITADEVTLTASGHTQYFYRYYPTSGTKMMSVGLQITNAFHQTDQHLDVESLRLREVEDPSWKKDHYSFRLISQGGKNITNGFDDPANMAPFADPSIPTYGFGLYPEAAESATARYWVDTGATKLADQGEFDVYIWDRVVGGFRGATIDDGDTTMMPNAPASSTENGIQTVPAALGVTPLRWRYNITTPDNHTNADKLADDLNLLGPNCYVFIIGSGELRDNRYGTPTTKGGKLLEAMVRCGASNTVFGAGNTDTATLGFQSNASYILVGTPGIGADGGAEAYSGTIDDDPSAWCEIDVNIIANSALQVSGSSVGSLTLEEELIKLGIDISNADAAAREAQRLAANASLHEVTIYTDAQDTDTFYAGSWKHLTAQYGDVWINANTGGDDKTVLPDGTLSTKAIHRWQNSIGGFANTPADHTTALAWRHAPNDAFGRIYLQSYAAQNVADRRSLIFWDHQYPYPHQPAPTYGPNVAISEDGTANPNPRGDLWFNTSNNTAAFVYLTNTSFSKTWGLGEDNAGTWAQTVYYTNEFNRASSKTGWYEGKDLSILAVNAVAYAANSLAANAYNLALFANNQLERIELTANQGLLKAASADHFVVGFFSDSEPIATGNGDIWIDTNRGPANSWIVSRWQNTDAGSAGIWYNANDHATMGNQSAGFMGDLYLQLFAEAKSGTKNYIPTELSLFGGTPPEAAYSIDTANRRSLKDFAITYDASGSWTVSLDSTKFWNSPRSLKVASGSAGSYDIIFSNTTATGTPDTTTFEKYGIDIPEGKKWILSYFSKETDSAGGVSEVAGIVAENSKDYTKDANVVTDTATNISNLTTAGLRGWLRQYVILDLSVSPKDELNKIILKLKPTLAGSKTVYYDGFQLEEVSIESQNPKPSDYMSADSFVGLTNLKGLSDGKVFTYIQPHGRRTIDGSAPTDIEKYRYNGPDPTLSPVFSDGETQIPNADPHGDLWYNTANNNTLYRYHANNSAVYDGTGSANLVSDLYYYNNGGYHGTLDGEYGQQLAPYKNVPSGGTFGVPPSQYAEAKSGWYEVRYSAIDSVNALSLSALSAGKAAQYAADREILAFFYDSDTVVSTFTPTGNGDVWIQTDKVIDSTGIKNLNAIFIANTLSMAGEYPSIDTGVTRDGQILYWNTAPDSAIGRMYLESYAAGVLGKFNRGTNIMPRGLSLFDAPTYDYLITEDSQASDIPYVIGTFNDAYGSVTLDDTVGHIGENSLKLTTVGSSGTMLQILFANTESDVLARATPDIATFREYGIPIPKGKKWIYSAYVKSNEALASGLKFSWYTSNVGSASHILGLNGEYDASGYPATSSAFDLIEQDNETVFTRYECVIDLTSGDSANSTHIIPGIQIKRTANIVNLDAFQLEEAVGDNRTASEFKEPSDGVAVIFGRRITDGKLVAFYGNEAPGPMGPNPEITPSGYPNPEPHGDFWINTEAGANNNMMFRYFANSSAVYQGTGVHAHTYAAIHGPGETPTASSNSGWYDIRDKKVYTAEILASAAQAAADREIIAFFENHNADVDDFKPTGNGDVWIHQNKTVNPNGTANLGAIFVANSGAHDSEGMIPTDHEDGGGNTLTWHRAPNNAIGLMYLQSYSETSGKVVTFFANSAAQIQVATYPSSAKWRGYGPLPETTPTGQPNQRPHGDMWLNTEPGSNNNQLFRYYQNAVGTYQGTGTANLTPYVFRYPNNKLAESNPKSGWYEMRDASIYVVNATAYSAVSDALKGIQDAADAAAKADRDIKTFIQPTEPTPLGNNDVWINTSVLDDFDRVNTWSVSTFVNNYSETTYDPTNPDTGFPPGTKKVRWEGPPDYEISGLGSFYLQAYLEATNRSKNYFPRPISLFDEQHYDYLITETSKASNTPYAIGIPQYSTTVTIDDTVGHIGENSLKMTIAGTTSSYMQILFANTRSTRAAEPVATPDIATFRKYGILVPKGRKWIYSAYVKSDTAITDGLKFSWYTSNVGSASHIFANSVSAVDLPASTDGVTFHRYSCIIDLTKSHNANVTHLIPGIQIDHIASHINFDAFQLEEIHPDVEALLPSAYITSDEGPGMSWSRGLTDRAMISHLADHRGTDPNYFGPDPRYDQNGRVVADPHGDFWCDTANNFAVFRYHANDSAVWAVSNDTGTANLGCEAFYYVSATNPFPGADLAVGQKFPKSTKGHSGWYEIRDQTVLEIERNLSGNAGRLETAQTSLQSVTAALTTGDGLDSLLGPLGSGEDHSGGLIERLKQVEILDDNEIVAFIQPTNPYPNVANGDIWVDTGRYPTVNSWSISRWQNTSATIPPGPDGYWANPNTYTYDIGAGSTPGYAPLGAFGKFFLTNYLASLGSNKNYMPRGYSLFDSRDDDYSIVGALTHAPATAIQRPYPITHQALELVPDSGTEVSSIVTSVGFDDTQESPVGGRTLKVVVTANASPNYGVALSFANTTNPMLQGTDSRKRFGSDFAINIPKASKWLFSAYVKTDVLPQVGHGVRATFTGANSSTIDGSLDAFHGGYVWGLEYSDVSLSQLRQGPDAVNEWKRLSWLFDLSGDIDEYTNDTGSHNLYANTFTRIIPRLDIRQHLSATPGAITNWHFAGLQLEQVAGDTSYAGASALEPTFFMAPDEGPSINWNRGLSDGAVRIYEGMSHERGGNWNPWGPDPTKTQSGIANPAPDGDRWLNTDLNLEFVYQANSTNRTSNSIYMFANTSSDAKSGWYLVGTIQPPAAPDSDGLRGHWKFDGAFKEGALKRGGPAFGGTTKVYNGTKGLVANVFHDYAGDMGPALVRVTGTNQNGYANVVNKLHRSTDAIIGHSFTSNAEINSSTDGAGVIVDLIDEDEPLWGQDTKERTLAVWFKPIAYDDIATESAIWDAGYTNYGRFGNANKTGRSYATLEQKDLWVEYSSNDRRANGHYSNAMFWEAGGGPEHYIGFGTSPGQRGTFTGTGAIKQNTWNFVVTTWDFNKSKQSFFIYNVDDGLVYANTNTTITVSQPAPSVNVHLGGIASGFGTSKEMVANFDEARYYDRVLTVPEIQGLFITHPGDQDLDLGGFVYEDGDTIDRMKPFQPGATDGRHLYLSVRNKRGPGFSQVNDQYAYLHGYNQDAQAAPVNGFIQTREETTDEFGDDLTVHKLTEAKHGPIKVGITGTKDDGYILYQTNAISGTAGVFSPATGGESRHFAFAQPTARRANSSGGWSTWRYDDGEGDWHYIYPNDKEILVIGDARVSKDPDFDVIDIWSLAPASPRTIRNSSDVIITDVDQPGVSSNWARELSSSGGAGGGIVYEDETTATILDRLADGDKYLHQPHWTRGARHGKDGEDSWIEFRANQHPTFVNNEEDYNNHLWATSIHIYWGQNITDFTTGIRDGVTKYQYAIIAKADSPGATWTNVAGVFTGLDTDYPTVSSVEDPKSWANSRPLLLANTGPDAVFFPTIEQQDPTNAKYAGRNPEGISLPTIDPVGQFVGTLRIFVGNTWWTSAAETDGIQDSDGGAPQHWHIASDTSDSRTIPSIHEVEIWRGSAGRDSYAGDFAGRPETDNSLIGDVSVNYASVIEALGGTGSEIADMIADTGDVQITDTMIEGLSGEKINAGTLTSQSIGSGAILTGHLEVLGGYNNLIFDPDFIHGYLQYPSPGVHRVTGVDSGLTESIGYGIEEQIRAHCAYDRWANGHNDGQCTANVTFDYSHPDISGYLNPAAGNIITANLHWTVAEVNRLNGGAGTHWSLIDYQDGADHITHPDAYSSDGGTVTLSADNSKMFMSVWLPPGYHSNGGSVGWWYESDWETGSQSDWEADRARVAISHNKVMFGTHGQAQNPVKLMGEGYVVGGSGRNEMRYTIGPTSNVGTDVTNPANRRLVSPANTVFSFSIWARKLDSQDHGTLYHDGTPKPPQAGNTDRYNHPGYRSVDPGPDDKNIWGPDHWDTDTDRYGALQDGAGTNRTGKANNIIRACAEFFAADGTRCGKIVGPWTEPFHQPSAGLSHVSGSVYSAGTTDADPLTKNFGRYKYGWREINFTGNGAAVEYGRSGHEINRVWSIRDRGIISPDQIPQTVRPEISYMTVGVEFSLGARVGTWGTVGDNISPNAQGAHYFLAGPKLARAVGTLDVDEINAGSITLGDFKSKYGIGTSGKMTLDGENSRIIVSD